MALINRNRIILIQSIILLILLFLLFRISARISNFKNDAAQWEALHDELKYNADSTIAKLKTITGSQKSAMQKLKIAGDSLSLKLAEAIKKGKGKTVTATIIKEEIIIKHDSFPVEVVAYDTIFRDSIIELRPVIESTHRDLWVSYLARFDSSGFSLDLVTYNTMKVTHKKRRGGIELIIENESPYAITKEAKSYVFHNKPKGQFDYGLFGGFDQMMTERRISAGGYAELKYKLITGEIVAGAEITPQTGLKPFAGLRLKYAIQRISF